jgi:hypothetical protein
MAAMLVGHDIHDNKMAAMLVGHDIPSSVQYSKFSIQNLNSGAFRPYNDDCNLAYDGKRLKWNNNFDILQKFLKNIVGLNGKWTSPGGNSKKFKSSNSDLTITWYYGKQKTLLFQGKEGYLFREFLINICETKAVSVSPIEVKLPPRQVNIDKQSAGATRVYFDDLTNTYISEDTASIADTSTLKELEDFIDNSFYNTTALPREDCRLLEISLKKSVILVHIRGVLMIIRLQWRHVFSFLKKRSNRKW